MKIKKKGTSEKRGRKEMTKRERQEARFSNLMKLTYLL